MPKRESNKPRGPQAIGDLVSELLSRRGVGRKLESQGRNAAWQDAVGEDLAGMTRPGPIRRGVMEVTVAHSALVQELTFEKSELLEKIREALGHDEIRDLRFRVGPVEG